MKTAMKSVISESVKLKAEAYQYQVKRFGNYRPQKPLQKAINKTLKPLASQSKRDSR